MQIIQDEGFDISGAIKALDEMAAQQNASLMGSGELGGLPPVAFPSPPQQQPSIWDIFRTGGLTPPYPPSAPTGSIPSIPSAPSVPSAPSAPVVGGYLPPAPVPLSPVVPQSSVPSAPQPVIVPQGRAPQQPPQSQQPMRQLRGVPPQSSATQDRWYWHKLLSDELDRNLKRQSTLWRWGFRRGLGSSSLDAAGILWSSIGTIPEGGGSIEFPNHAARDRYQSGKNLRHLAADMARYPLEWQRFLNIGQTTPPDQLRVYASNIVKRLKNAGVLQNNDQVVVSNPDGTKAVYQFIKRGTTWYLRVIHPMPTDKSKYTSWEMPLFDEAKSATTPRTQQQRTVTLPRLEFLR